MATPTLVGANIDTFIGNARLRSDFPENLADQLEDLKRQSQDTEEDLPTPWRFAGEVLFIKPHGAGRQWRWILHSPSIHVDMGLGKLTHIVAKARLSSASLWEHEIGTALTLLYGFLAEVLQVPFTLQVSEVHLCVDMADWGLALNDISAFITRSRSKGLRLGSDAADEELDASLEAGGPFTTPTDVRVQFAGRRLATLDFSKGAPHACCLYDKTAEIAVSRKEWMQEVWKSNGWDGESRVTRVEFRFSQLWQLVQQASFFCDGTPAVRERRRAGDLTLLCQMIAGCSTTAAAYLAGNIPADEDGTHFLLWFMTWQEEYLRQKQVSFGAIRDFKQTVLGVVTEAVVV